jgi:NAD(P)-dependent dehydrogenase (short-subunit alcohol dehydrogenase family)
MNKNRNTRALAIELALIDIRVVSLSPGSIDTEMLPSDECSMDFDPSRFPDLIERDNLCVTA